VIYGVGTDIVQVARVARSLARFGERFAGRVLSETELADFRRNVKPAHFLARRFAAKEAAVKAMGTGFVDGLRFRHIAVTHDRRGKPELSFVGPALRFMQTNRIAAAHLSLADEEDHAIAFVTLEAASF
jgi:holo-[acyl-carrier protein] synthase